ncbi:TonB-dependent receptor [Rhabdobacter roseus]|uniref:TonB-linked SusC/RagA family outer membrane protein n=2 Tax=Rhabdobacter roseus TaxID=1655419 RepID=A0A840U5N8_9BACT|nr:TonB-linked SusC/RagA family outer membrane protein [Rhabdobacter roseus]
MKLSSFILAITCLHVSAASFSQKVALSVKDAPLTTVFHRIEQQSSYTFFYDNKLVRKAKRVTLDFTGGSVKELMDELMKEQPLTYQIVDQTIVIKKKEERQQSLHNKAGTEPRATPVLEAESKDVTIRGKVTDDKGEELPGVSILIKGTQRGTITDAQGNYTLEVPDQAAVLVFSFVGYVPQEVVVGSRTSIAITLRSDEKILDEVVVVGFGTQKKQSVVGAIVQTTNEELRRTGNVTDLKQALTGQLPGLTTITSSGEPGGTLSSGNATDIYIRGRNTWNGGQPLILIDGVEREMSNVDVSEVESISVLKDASATAVFGVRGANGVILITTKRGSESKPQLSVNYSATALSVSRLPEKLDSYEAIMTRNEMIEREGLLSPVSWADYVPYDVALRYQRPQSPTNAMLYPNVDWAKAMFREVSWSQRANLNITGGSNFVKYFGSLAYLNESDMFKKYDNHKGYDPSYGFNRFNFRSNLDFKLTKTTNMRVNLAGLFSQKNTNYSFNNGSSGTNPLAWAAAYRFPPDVILPQYEDGSWGQSYALPPEALQNPVALIYNTGVWQQRNVELRADFLLEQKLDFLIKGLSYTGTLFYDNGIQTVGGIGDQNHARPEGNLLGKIVFPDLYRGGDQDPSEYTQATPVVAANAFDWVVTPWNINAETTSASAITRRLTHQHQLNYVGDFNRHHVGGMGLFKREQYAQGSMFPTYREEWVFRTTYDFDTRYLFEFNGAYNGSEKFGPGYRFDFFPSLALGWYASNEKFFNLDWMNRLKFRYSVGMVGDDTGGARWAYQSQYRYGGEGINSALLNANPNERSPYFFYKEQIVGNPNIRWEKARKTNYGAEIGLFKDLVSINFDYFTDNRTDIIISGTSRAIPPYFGATPPAANLGQVKSKGFELELRLNKAFPSGVHLWGAFAVTHTENKIINRDDPFFQVGYLKQAGYQIGQVRTQVRSGFYNNWDEVFASTPQQTNDLHKLPGYYNILDFNGDGVITPNDDTVPFGYSEVPQNNYNASMGGSYKGFSVMVQFYGVNNVSRNIPLSNFYQFQNTLFAHVRDHWSQDNPDATSFLPRWKSQGQFIGDYFIYDGSYLRLRTAELAYTFQPPVLKRLGFSNLRTYVNGNNLLFWSRLPDDREAASSGGDASAGAYPTPIRINIGIDLTF